MRYIFEPAPDISAELHSLIAKATSSEVASFFAANFTCTQVVLNCTHRHLIVRLVPKQAASLTEQLQRDVAAVLKRVLKLNQVEIKIEGAQPDDSEVAYLRRLIAQRDQIAQVQAEIAPKTNQPEKQNGGKRRGKKSTKNQDPDCLYGTSLKDLEPVALAELEEGDDGLVVQGEIFRLEERTLTSGRLLVSWDMTDYTNSLTVKLFCDEVREELAIGSRVRVRGTAQIDKYSGELILLARDVMLLPATLARQDQAPVKRCELHLHTQMSAMDATVNVDAAFKLAAAWGHSALAITDHGVVQAFPDAYAAGKKYGVKPIYGLEAYLVNDRVEIISHPPCLDLKEATYVVFDLETTGFNPGRDEIIEIGAVKLEPNGNRTEFSSFIKPQKGLPPKITELTGITAAMLQDAPEARQVLPAFFEFAGEAVLVAHNAAFDFSFLCAWQQQQGQDLARPVLDTLNLARSLRPDLRSHKLDALSREFQIELVTHHRAKDDAQATLALLQALLTLAQAQGIRQLPQLNTLVGEINVEKLPSFHITLLAATQEGLKNLYQLVSLAHIQHFYRHPRILRSELEKYREGLLVGSACEAGELFRGLVRGLDDDQLLRIAQFYDYLELMPRANNDFMLRSGQFTLAQLEEFNRRLYNLGLRAGKPVVATGDVHFLHPEDAIFRRILQASQDFKDADLQPPLYLRTTEEMLAEFAYLGPEAAQAVVVDYPQQIANQVEAGIKPVPDQLYAPRIEGAEEQIRQMTYAQAEATYGQPLPPLVAERLETELTAIIDNGFAVLYLIAHKLVQKSLQDGYLVGSRGSVGSSFVATMCGITEVNPLPPHYLCPACHYSEFITDGSVGAGVDLPAKKCPHCANPLDKAGFDIPFAVFMGFHGEKVPDIDLNFSGEYQAVVHKYTEELFGADHVFRAGTIGTLAERTAYGLVKKFLDERNLKVSNAEVNRLVAGLTGVKRTTGQHPGGVMVVPQDHDIHEFTPIQYPANDPKAGVTTTHFDYKAISSRLVKLDILGHDDPTVIRMLQDLTGVDPRSIPLDDPETLALFSGVESLGVTSEQLGGLKIGSLGIPEFGTRFVRQMLEDTRPQNFSDLVRISGFSHGTDVWLNNAQDLIKAEICQLGEAISTRDDIMIYLIYNGVPASTAFKIMEQVRKGKGLKPEDEEVMKAHKIPDWFIESCQKIKYLFPKAHAVAYVTMAFRIAWFKVHYPAAFYASYFTVRADEFDAETVRQGPGYVRAQMQTIEEKGNAATAKEKNLVAISEVVLEAMARGIEFLPVDLYASEVKCFRIIDGCKLLPPLVALEGLGEAAAGGVAEARKQGPFRSIEDLQEQARISKTVIEVLRQHGCLAGLPETNQLELAL